MYKDGNFALSSATEAEKGWIDSLNFKVNAQAVKWEFDSKNQDICVLHLATPLKPGERLTVSTPFKIKIPSESKLASKVPLLFNLATKGLKKEVFWYLPPIIILLSFPRKRLC